MNQRKTNVPLAMLLGIPSNAELDRYTVDGLLGQGAMGKVFLGRDKKLDREVVIKVIMDGEATKDKDDRFYREAHIAAALNHPAIVKILDYSGRETARQFIVMERLAGHTLQRFVEAGPLSEAVALSVGHAIAQALAHAHGRGLIHRDVKPDNIFIEPEGRVALIDFGIAKGLRMDGDRSTFQFKPTALLGTPMFASPEQYNNKHPLSPKSDLFSLGSTLYFSVTQVFPFQGNTLLEVLRHLGSSPALPLDKLIDPSPEFHALIDALMEKEPERRPESADAVVDVIEQLLAKHGVVSPSSTVRNWARQVPLSVLPIKPVDVPAPVPKQDPKTRIVTAPAAEGSPSEPLAPSEAPRHRAGILLIAASLIVAVFVVWLSSTPTKTAPPSPPPGAAVAETLPPPLVTVFFVVKPWGRISIDGEAKGMTPAFRRAELSAGRHVVVATHPSLGERTLTIDVAPSGDQEFVIDFSR